MQLSHLFLHRCEANLSVFGSGPPEHCPPGAPGRDAAGAHDPPDPRRIPHVLAARHCSAPGAMAASCVSSCASWRSSLYGRLACSGGIRQLRWMAKWLLCVVRSRRQGSLGQQETDDVCV